MPKTYTMYEKLLLIRKYRSNASHLFGGGMRGKRSQTFLHNN